MAMARPARRYTECRTALWRPNAVKIVKAVNTHTSRANFEKFRRRARSRSSGSTVSSSKFRGSVCQVFPYPEMRASERNPGEEASV